MLEGQDCRDLTILDIGCGCGGAVFHLIRTHGAAHATGIDVEPLVIDRAQELAENYGLTNQTKFETVIPGPLPFDDQSFDMIFSKDAFLHIPDKETL